MSWIRNTGNTGNTGNTAGYRYLSSNNQLIISQCGTGTLLLQTRVNNFLYPFFRRKNLENGPRVQYLAYYYNSPSFNYAT
jgi:hypothetical protein